MQNQLKKMLSEGKVALGATVTIGHPDIAEALGLTGYDWLLLDTEHAPLEPGILQNLLQAMSGSKTVPIARVPWNDLVLIKRVLDVGVHGIVVPWVNTKEEAERAVQAVKYPPLGLRGYGPRRAAMVIPQYFETANQEVMLGVQIETQKAVDNMDEILSVKGIDAALVGPSDLSLSMGIFSNFKHERFVSAMDKIAEACKRHRVVAGMLAVDDVSTRVKQGYTLLNKGTDLSLLREAATRSLAESREATRNAPTTPSSSSSP